MQIYPVIEYCQEMNMKQLEIKTERLVLKPLGTKYIDTVNEYALDMENTKYMCFLPNKDAEETKAFLQRVDAEWQKEHPSFYEFAIFCNDTHIGAVSVSYEEGKGELGWILNKKYWGNGFAYEAAKAVMEFSFRQDGINHFIAHCDAENSASFKTMEKLGMVKTGEYGGRRNRSASEDSTEYRYETEISLTIKSVMDEAEKQRIASLVLEALPEWFGIKEARDTYIEDSKKQIMIACFLMDKPLGFITLKETGKDTVEIAVMGVLKEWHGKGIGTKMFEKAKQTAMKKGYSFIQVKTVQMGRYAEYDRTNLFYLHVGFKEFEVLPDLWDIQNPCQIYVMALPREA